jgi:3-oxoacyl-[acyl-carrier protein] reductase
MPTAIITGSSTGIGKAITLKLLDAGWHIHGFSRRDGGFAHANYSSYQIDVADSTAVQNAVAAVLAKDSIVDLLINNAGAASMNALMLTPGKVAENLMRVNYLGAFHCLQAVGKQMVRQRRGLIINITTVAVPLALEGEAAYVASKAAVDALTKVAAKELAPHGVAVIGVGLGPVPTRLTRAVDEKKLQKLNVLIGRPNGTTLDEAVDFIFSTIKQEHLVSGSIRYLGQIESR